MAYAPCEENRSTIASTEEPTGWLLTNWMKGIGSLIGVVSFEPERRRRREPDSPDASDDDSDAAVLGACLAAFFVEPAAFFAGAAAPFVPAAFLARPAPGGGLVGTGSGRLASSEPEDVPRFAPRFSRVARRLVGPRTGVRHTKTQPMAGTGLAPRSRPSSNNQSYCPPWNSWNESFEKTVPFTLSATWRMNASPRPIAPAGGVTISPFTIPASNSGRSLSSMRCPKVASTTTVSFTSPNSSSSARTASSS